MYISKLYWGYRVATVKLTKTDTSEDNLLKVNLKTINHMPEATLLVLKVIKGKRKNVDFSLSTLNRIWKEVIILSK